MNEKNTINYLKSLRILNNLRRFSGSPDLNAIKTVLKNMDNFQNNLNIIHITGTNGKGSTLRFLERIYLSAGYSVGAFTSPQILKANEHIRINGKDISDKAFSKWIFHIDETCKKIGVELTYFETLTIISLLEMDDKNVDIALIEVGIGTELDSTNVFKEKTTVFTKIAVDHERLLGNTAEEVAKSKSKLITKGGKVVLGKNKGPIAKIIEKKAMEMNCQFYTSKNLKMSYNSSSYQDENIATALAVIRALEDVFPVDYDSAVNSLKDFKPPLRLEWINDFILLDSAHNTSGILALKDYVKSSISPKKTSTIFGVLADKNPEQMLELVEEFSDEVILTRPLSDRAYDFKEKENFFLDYKEAIDLALKKHENEVIIICGSFYLTTHAKEYLTSKDILKKRNL